MYTGDEPFIVKNQNSDLKLLNFWQWAYSDLLNNISRSVLAEYIVASALDLPSNGEDHRIPFRPYDLLTTEGWRIEVKCASYVQSWDVKHPDHVSYRIAPSIMLDPDVGYPDDAPKQRNCDCYVFCLYKATSPDQNPLDMSLWEFRVLKTSILNEKKPTQKTITLPSLQDIGPVLCDYNNLKSAVFNVMNDISCMPMCDPS